MNKADLKVYTAFVLISITSMEIVKLRTLEEKKHTEILFHVNDA